MQLHQLSLDGNPLVCDCRSRSLKQWLLSSRTPLSAPIRCHQQPRSPLDDSNAALWPMEPMESAEVTTQRPLNSSPTSSQRQEEVLEFYLDQVELGDFVCAPSWAGAASGPVALADSGGLGLAAQTRPLWTAKTRQRQTEPTVDSNKIAIPSERQSGAAPWPLSRSPLTGLKLSSIFEYLEPTLVVASHGEQKSPPEATLTTTTKQTRDKSGNFANKHVAAQQPIGEQNLSGATKIESLYAIEGKRQSRLLPLTAARFLAA